MSRLDRSKKKESMYYNSLFRVGSYWQTLHNSALPHRLIGSKVPAKKMSTLLPKTSLSPGFIRLTAMSG